MIQSFNKADKIGGELSLPGDKSVSHRSVMFASLAKGRSKIYNLSNGDDVKSTRKCFADMGVNIFDEAGYVVVDGAGFRGLKKPASELDAGNSGTTTRLISGILVAQNFETVITGDASLSKRPMKRIIQPLTQMGGKIRASENFTLPMTISPAEKLNPINYELPMASAQVKSAVLLAGLHLEGTSSVIESIPSRDHTERMLGLRTELRGSGKVSYVSRDNYPVPKEYIVPSDISTAAFFIVLTLLSDNSELRIKNVSLNETRTGILTVLKEMGGKIDFDNVREAAGEPLGDIIIRSSRLHNIEIQPQIIPNIIDEIPILAVAGIFAEGVFKITQAEELRGKETDRINAVCVNLKKLGLSVKEYKDGFEFSGDINDEDIEFESFDDHRIAMSCGILSLLLKHGGKVNNFDCVSISNPDFINQLKQIVR